MNREKATIFLCEAGIIVFDESSNIIAASKFKGESAMEALRKIKESPQSELSEALSILRQRGFEELVVTDDQLKSSLSKAGYNVSVASHELNANLQLQKIDLMLKAGLASSEEDAKQAIRRYSLEVSEEKIRILSASPDLHVTQAIQALDEVDKTFNILSTRLREWYGLHFPELDGLVSDPSTYAKITMQFRRREAITMEELENLRFSEKRSEAILVAASKSKGGVISDEDLNRTSALAQELLHFSSLRDKLAKHVERIMEDIAPNVSVLAGATIGARLMSKAGGLQRLAALPASTIQILGAEKALFRAIRTGAKPPKHGILFQHQAVHSAPKWQRGKVARSMANKIAIAARIDAFRGTRDLRLEETLQKRLEEIRAKYPEPPRPVSEERRKKRRNKGGKG